MCYTCWEEAGVPAIQNERVLAAADAIRAVFQFSSVGGNAHVVVDDWNLDDTIIDYCLGEVTRLERRQAADPGQLAAERTALEQLRALFLTERHSAMALVSDFWRPV